MSLQAELLPCVYGISDHVSEGGQGSPCGGESSAWPLQSPGLAGGYVGLAARWGMLGQGVVGAVSSAPPFSALCSRGDLGQPHAEVPGVTKPRWRRNNLPTPTGAPGKVPTVGHCICPPRLVMLP